MATRAQHVYFDDAGQVEDAASRPSRGAPRLFLQIGPRIRVGGTVGKIGQNVKSAVTKGVSDVGHTVGAIASNPLVQTLTAAALAATGVGAPAAAGIMAAERGGGALLKRGGNIGEGLKGAATGAVMGAGASKVGDLLYHGLGTIGSGSGALGGIANTAGGLPSSLKDIISGGGADGKGSLGTVGDVAGNVAGKLLGGGGGGTGTGGGTGGGTSLLDKLLLGGTVAASAADEVHKRDLQNRAADAATSAYDANAPLRAKALALLANPPGPDPRLATIAADPGNVYDRARRARLLAASVAGPAPQPTGVPVGTAPLPIGGHTFPDKVSAA